MNKFSLVVLFLVSLSSYANDPLKACLEFDYDSQKNECIKIVNDGYYSEKAAMFCIEFDYSSQKFDCLKSIKNKTFTPSALDICADYTYTSQKMECIKLTGKDYIGATDLEVAKLRRISTIANEIKVDIYEGNLTNAISKLSKIIALTSEYIID